MAKAPAVQAKNKDQGDLIEKIEETPIEQTENESVTDDDALLAAADEPVAEDASAALQKQIDALRKSETIQKDRAEKYRQESERNQQLVKDRTTEVEKVRKEAFQSQLDAVSTALGAAQSEAESAKRDIKTAINEGNVDAQADAYERLASARANISKLEDGKFEIESRIKAPVEVKEEKPLQQEQNALPQRIQGWLSKHPEFLNDRRKNDKIRALHWDVIEEGHDFDSEGYIESMETKLGMREAETEDEPIVQPRQSQQRTSIVSAPVSREAPSTPNTPRGGEIKLSVAQREAAKIAGVTEKAYAEQLQKINRMKANGSYGGQQ